MNTTKTMKIAIKTIALALCWMPKEGRSMVEFMNYTSPGPKLLANTDQIKDHYHAEDLYKVTQKAIEANKPDLALQILQKQSAESLEEFIDFSDHPNSFLGALFRAAAKCDCMPVLEFLYKTVGYDHVDNYSNSFTALMFAAATNALDAAEYLITTAKADVNKSGITSSPALLLACYYKNPDMVYLLLKNKANVDIKTIRSTPLIQAYKALDASKDLRLKHFLNKIKRTGYNQTDPSYNSFNVYSYQRSRTLEPIYDGKILIDAYNNFNVEKYNDCPLSERVRIIFLLLKYNANLNLADNMGRTILHYAYEHKDYGMVEFLLNQVKTQNNNDTAILSSVLNLADKNGYTILHYACERGDYDMIEFLLNQGMTLNNHDTPILYSVCDIKNKSNMIKFLLQKGADPLEKNKKDQKNTLEYAVDRRMEDTLLTLVDLGVSYNTESTETQNFITNIINKREEERKINRIFNQVTRELPPTPCTFKYQDFHRTIANLVNKSSQQNKTDDFYTRVIEDVIWYNSNDFNIISTLFKKRMSYWISGITLRFSNIFTGMRYFYTTVWNYTVKK